MDKDTSITTQTNALKGSRNNAVDIFRFVCSVMVVMIHTQPFVEIDARFGYFFLMIFPRIAVPFYFSIAGYYYIKSLLSGKEVFARYFKRLLIVYSLWSALYFLLKFIDSVVLKQSSISSFIKQCVIDFFISGSNYQLWFFPALFFAIILTTLCFKMKWIKILAYSSLILYIIGCLGSSYFTIGNYIPGISYLINFSRFTRIRGVALMGLPFFLLGYFLNIVKSKIMRISNQQLFPMLLIAVILFFAEIFVVIRLDLQVNVVITIFLYPLVALTIILLVNNPLPKRDALSKHAMVIANFTYYSHPIFILFINHIAGIVKISSYNTLLFLLTMLLSATGGIIISFVNNKWVNKLVY